MRCLLIAAAVFVLSGCSFDPNWIIDTRTTGGENAMRSIFSEAEVSLRNGDKSIACDTMIFVAEGNVDLSKDISKGTMSLLRSYQKRCGRYVFK